MSVRSSFIAALAGAVVVSVLVRGSGGAREPAQTPPMRPLSSRPGPPPAREPEAARRCPSEMVDVAGRFCIDRWEIALVDARSGRSLSPYYHSSPILSRRDRREWEKKAPETGPEAARHIPLPGLPEWQLERDVEPRAVSAPDRIPSAYLDLESARRACANAQKRVCARNEWQMACRSERATRHPYGAEWDPTRCNLDAAVHPGITLHGRAETGGRDPRMNLVEYGGRTPLRPTGSLLGCASAWEDDAVYDMEGNLDEWIDDPAGTFVGGFYARDTHWGCDARVEIHSADYYDYSLGARCCR